MAGALVSKSLESQVTPTSIPEEVFCYYQPTADTSTTFNYFFINGCFGSQYAGMSYPLVDCATIDSPTYNNGFYVNLAAGARIGFIFNGIPNTECQGTLGAYAYHNRVGVMMYPPDTKTLLLKTAYLFEN